MIGNDFARATFRSHMVMIRELCASADPEMARYYHRELNRELPELEKKFQVNIDVVVDSAVVLMSTDN